MKRRQMLGMTGIMAVAGAISAPPLSAETDAKRAVRLFDVNLEVQGDKSEHVVLMNSDLSAAAKAMESGPEVATNAVTLSGNAAKSGT